MGVDVVTCLARPDCWQQALQSNDYHPYGRCPLHMYQSGSRNAAVDDLMLTMLEGDHAYC
jgi:hypothetical protein